MQKKTDYFFTLRHTSIIFFGNYFATMIFSGKRQATLLRHFQATFLFCKGTIKMAKNLSPPLKWSPPSPILNTKKLDWATHWTFLLAKPND
jgi:hypothetical protein